MVNRRSSAELLDAGEEAWIEASFCTGDFALSRKLLGEARNQAARDGNEELEAAACDRLGMVQHYMNITRRMSSLEVEDSEIDAEEELFCQALAVSERRNDLAGVAQSLFGLGLVFQVLRSEWTSAITLFRGRSR